MEIRRRGFALGATVTGVDLSRPLAANAVRQLREAWLDHLLLCFPEQRLSAEQFRDFCANFGELDDFGSLAHFARAGDPHVLIFTSESTNGTPSNTRDNGQHWHSDGSFSLRPAAGTFLLCERAPSVGGDTEFTNMYMAYETLSPRMRELLDGLEAVHDIVHPVSVHAKREDFEALRRSNPAVVQRVVKPHPETGRMRLFISERVRQFVGMTQEESSPLLDFLTRHAVSRDFVHRHYWTQGDLVMWDNRCTQHLAVGNFDHSEARTMLRCSTLGEASGYLYTEQADEAIA